MKTTTQSSIARRSCQRGVAAVEFALVSFVFFTLLIGLMEMGRLLFYWNSAAEATRWGARIAVVCDLNDADIKSRMQMILPLLPENKITVSYEPAGCNADTCESVTVSVASGVSVATAIPFVPLSLALPPFSTTLPRESMRSTFGGQANPVCG